MRKTTIAALVLAGWVGWQTRPADAAVKLHGLFTDNMVLQREMPVPVWGTAEPGEDVNLQLFASKDAATASEALLTKADKDGKWKVVLKAMAAGGPFKIVVAGKDNKVELKNVLVGEVWIASGQSNMEWALQITRDPKEVIANSKNSNIRLFDVPKTPNAAPQHELGTAKAGKGREFGKWLECGPDSVAAFSAVGYYFARAIERDVKVPVGIINCSWSGVAAERYTAKSILESHEALKDVKPGKTASDLYNGMIVPMQPFAFRGVIWYQGESNASQPKRYYHLMNAMIQSWRDDWKQGDFPFLTVQLAPYDVPKVPGQWAELREAQLFTRLKVKNSAMAVITDSGDPKDIHPKDKLPVGERLARAARGLALGQAVEYNGPMCQGVKFEGGKAILTFGFTGGGLVAKGGPLTGFTIGDSEGKFVKAEATISDNTVIVHSPDVPEPAAVRFGWANYPTVNLFNKEGLPATPFRTDVPDYYR